MTPAHPPLLLQSGFQRRKRECHGQGVLSCPLRQADMDTAIRKAQPDSMQHEAAPVGRASVFAVAHNGVPTVGQLYPNLVRTSGVQTNQQKTA